jgi:hypothetical protein
LDNARAGVQLICSRTFVWDPVAAEERKQEALIEYAAILVDIQGLKGSS